MKTNERKLSDRDQVADRHGVSRRSFIGTTAAGSAALLTGGLQALLRRSTLGTPSLPGGPWVEATIPQLQVLLASGHLTSVELTQGYLDRIAALNPLVHAVIETNPHALEIARHFDVERHQGRLRGPLHGIPIIVKDNIGAAGLQTTAGSLALVDCPAPDALIVKRLRSAGAIILGKANLSEWANFRGFAPFNGWSARGGFTRDPYLLSFDPCGSSSGSAVAAATNLCAAAVGTETDGSVVCPSGNNLIVGLKPTLGLISQDGIIPIAHSQDTAGPMARTVVDVAILLNVLRSPFGPVMGHSLPHDYTAFLHTGALHGKRIGVDRRYFTADFGGEDDLIAVVQKGLDAMTALGAILVDTDTGDPDAYFNEEFTVLLVEFKLQIAQYLATRHCPQKTLADLIAFNIANCPEEMKYFGQEVFEMSEATSGDLNDPDYKAARAKCLQLSRAGGIDGAIARDHLDAIVAPSYSFASSPAAVAGYPDISIPVGLTPEGKPAGIWMYSGFLQEPKLLAFAYDLEQALHPRHNPPQFLGSVPPEPPDAGICGAPRPAAAAARSQRPRRLGPF